MKIIQFVPVVARNGFDKGRRNSILKNRIRQYFPKIDYSPDEKENKKFYVSLKVHCYKQYIDLDNAFKLVLDTLKNHTIPDDRSVIKIQGEIIENEHAQIGLEITIEEIKNVTQK